MKTNDPIFGELTYGYGWTREVELDFFEKRNIITLIVDGDEEGRFDQDQYIAYQTYLENWHQLQSHVLQSLLQYYQQKKQELGYDIAINADYPAIEGIEQIRSMVTLEAIAVPYGDIHKERNIGLLFTCTWDPENGVGVRLLNEGVAEVGYQDATI
ncbi:DUF6985 domain-containing protein [Paenibacillus hunanensis]|uniref:DUF6985 domain-containing protein n=1 Tax=Paenibacillus hunanensis TaxID=539262 RepID=A0ABU1J1Z6_9BACL|nr:DUF2004 domain-containing protein [Paenibacillus hunanensis]MDR6245531.1 hypothetical protein [Paenibacillus hunanensis]GGJ09840.1 hypothetical protein GCM10008022_18710 [Paenibacillus hunanensis]